MSKDLGKLSKELISEPINGWETKFDEKEVEAISKDYLDFLKEVRTEREFVRFAEEQAEKSGFKNLEDVHEWSSGIKVYYKTNKLIFLAHLKTNPLFGLKITASHVDSPRLDFKPHPLYEDEGLAFMKTHYYGGVKKYQWVSLPLELHGSIFKENGEEVVISIGSSKNDPVFVIADLLPHLGKEQMKKPTHEAVPGESLNILVGGRPLIGKGKEKVKLQVLKILNEKYGLIEEDFYSGELEAVPAVEPREVGFDRSLIGGYGQDDKSHGFITLRSFLHSCPKKTCIACFFDKEEIGSEGVSSAQSQVFEYFISKLLDLSNKNKSYSGLYECLTKSEVLSTDVTAALNPGFKEVYDLRNSSHLGFGPVIDKYTGAGGKYDASEANAEFVAKIRQLLNKNKIPWQSGELGKIDEGGGGTVAMYFARRGCQVLDFGIGVLAMHSPFEVSSKIDIYYMYKAVKAFFEEKY